MNKRYICLVIIFLILYPIKSYAINVEIKPGTSSNSKKTSENYNTNDILKEQEETFGISNFIKEADKYSNDFLDEDDISNMISSAVTGKINNKTLFKKILNLLGSEVSEALATLVGVLVIVLIHSILKALTENLGNGDISKIIYYVQYILIITIIMKNFSSILVTVTETIKNLIGFANSLIPLLMTLMLFTGSIATSGLLEPIILMIIEVVGNIIVDLILPCVSIIVALIIVSKISDKVQIGKLASFMKSSVVWVLGIILTCFVGVLSLEGNLTSSVDGITAKTTKAAVSSLIPVVGKILGDSVDAVLGCGLVLKNAVGLVGVIIVVGICILPIIKLATLSIIYSISAAVIEPLADAKIVKLLDEIGGIFKLLLAILCSASVLLIIGVTLVIKISNSGMMYK